MILFLGGCFKQKGVILMHTSKATGEAKSDYCTCISGSEKKLKVNNSYSSRQVHYNLHFISQSLKHLPKKRDVIPSNIVLHPWTGKNRELKEDKSRSANQYSSVEDLDHFFP